MRLHLYLAQRFFWVFCILFIVLAVIFVLLDMVEALRRFDAAVLGLATVFKLTLLKAPSGLYQMLPLVVILSSIWLFLSLARSSELVVIRAAGRSALVSLVAPISVVFVLGIIAITLANPLASFALKAYERAVEKIQTPEASVLAISKAGVWLRQGDAESQIVIHAQHANLEGTKLFGARFDQFSPDGEPLARLFAESAELLVGKWHLQNVKLWRFQGLENPETHAETFQNYDLKSNLTIDQIRDSFGEPSAISLWDLPEFIDNLETAGFSARAHKVWLQMELAKPFFLVAMVLIGAGFTMRHARFGGAGVMVLLAVSMGFSAYFIRNFVQILGESGQIPIGLAAWAPPIAAMCLPLGLVLHLEDG